MQLLYNGQLIAEAAFALPLPNRGLYFNDGFFETLVWADGRLRYAAHHHARMQRAAAALQLALPAALATAEALATTLGQLAQANHLPAARLRLQLWRGGGGRYTPATEAAEWLATAAPFTPDDSPIATADFAETVRTLASPVSFCKGPHAALYVLAAQERARRGLDELMLLDATGHVAEAGAAALFWVTDGQLFTPSLATGCVAGVRRAHLLHVARQHGITVQEVLLVPKELQEAEIVFTANVASLRVVNQLAGKKPAATHSLLTQLRQWEATMLQGSSELNSNC